VPVLEVEIELVCVESVEEATDRLPAASRAKT
jgi:hypothetical protein